jgi:hypothetical protein
MWQLLPFYGFCPLPHKVAVFGKHKVAVPRSQQS